MSYAATIGAKQQEREEQSRAELAKLLHKREPSATDAERVQAICGELGITVHELDKAERAVDELRQLRAAVHSDKVLADAKQRDADQVAAVNARAKELIAELCERMPATDMLQFLIKVSSFTTAEFARYQTEFVRLVTDIGIEAAAIERHNVGTKNAIRHTINGNPLAFPGGTSEWLHKAD